MKLFHQAKHCSRYYFDFYSVKLIGVIFVVLRVTHRKYAFPSFLMKAQCVLRQRIARLVGVIT